MAASIGRSSPGSIGGQLTRSTNLPPRSGSVLILPDHRRAGHRGLAGLLIIDDEDTDRLKLPSRWGVDDIPLIIQDRRFRQDGQFFDRMNITAVTNGYVGDVPLVNGVRYPEVRTTRGWVRLRLLDGSNARSYVLKASDGRSLFVIGSDGGLLESPVELKQIAIHAGERIRGYGGLPLRHVVRPRYTPGRAANHATAPV